MGRNRKMFGVAVVALLGILLVVSAAVAFGMSAKDRATLGEFSAAVGRWQRNPDFRAVQREYVDLGTRAMQARWCGFSAGSVVMGFRSLPGLPKGLRTSETSAAHYDAFSRGPLSAYLHLSNEQDVEDVVPMVMRLAARVKPPGDAEVVAFLRSFRLPVPVASDDGAVRGVRGVLRDVGTTPMVPSRLPPLLKFQIAQLCEHLGVSGDVKELTARQQARVLAELDDWLKQRDPSAWATKQASDLLAGIWAQSYGMYYARGIDWLFRIQRIALGIFALDAGAMAMLIVRLRQRGRASAESSSSLVSAGVTSN